MSANLVNNTTLNKDNQKREFVNRNKMNVKTQKSNFISYTQSDMNFYLNYSCGTQHPTPTVCNNNNRFYRSFCYAFGCVSLFHVQILWRCPFMTIENVNARKKGKLKMCNVQRYIN